MLSRTPLPFLLLIHAVAIGWAARATASPQEALLFANCPREAGEYRGRYRGRVVLHRALLGDDDPRASVEQQLRYLWGHYRNDAAARRTMQVTLSAEPPDVHILSRREVPYGRRLALPFDTRDPRLQIDDPYTRRAVARGQVERTDPALLVEYELTFKAAVCGRAQDPPASVRVPLPRDPWLAYWLVPRAKHRPLRYFERRAVTNPCADDDFADLPHPFYYWYDWLPTRHGPDDDGRGFDCRRWLHAGDDYDLVDVTLERTASASRDFSRLRGQLGSGPLTATVVVGAIDHGVTDLGVERWRALLGDGAAGTLAARVAAARAAPESAGPLREPGTRAYLALLADLSRALAAERHTTRVDDGNLVTEVQGRLERSGRPVRVRLALGLTDVFGPSPPRHWGLLRRALAEDQIVVYWGHAGIGENFRLAQIERHAGITHDQMSAELRRSPLRLVAFLSCYSYMYFGRDLLEAGAARESGAHLLYTAIGRPRREAGPMAVLDLVDRVLEPGTAGGHVTAVPRLGDDEFWLVKAVSGTAESAAR